MAILFVTVFVVDADALVGKVTDVVPATAGTVSVTAPLVSPDITTELIINLPT